MTNPDPNLPSLDALQKKIDKVKELEDGPTQGSTASDMSQAMRMSIDLVAGVVVGTGFGYLVDRWLGTMPWCMITGVFIGMAAGVRNMLRSAKIIDKQSEINEPRP